MRPIPIGLIGAGKHGARYLNHLRADVPALRLAALSRHDVVQGRAQAAAYGCPFHDDWRALVADPGVEGVIAVVPPALHRAIAEATASAGKALLIEKPLATTSADAFAIARILRDAGTPSLMAHTLRWNTVVRAARETLAGLGPLRALAVNQRFEPSPLAWLDRPELSGGGIVLHTGVHSFDLVRRLTGRDVVRVRCRTARVVTERTEDNFMALLELGGDPALVTVSGCRATAGRSGLIDAACADAQLVGDHQQHWLQTVRGLQRTPVPLPPAAMTVSDALHAFAALLVDGTRPPVELLDGAHAVAIAEACLRSGAANGDAVDVARP